MSPLTRDPVETMGIGGTAKVQGGRGPGACSIAGGPEAAA